MRARDITFAGIGILTLSACAAQKSAAPPAASAESTPAKSHAQDAYDAQPGAAPQTPPPASPQPAAPSATRPAEERSGDFAEPPPANRAAALRNAARDMESSQRELDVAAGDCQNACRALGSMDRAAGRLCALAEATDELRRCEDSKQKVYSARDRVRSTCGNCPNGASVERSAPIPSTR